MELLEQIESLRLNLKSLMVPLLILLILIFNIPFVQELNNNSIFPYNTVQTIENSSTNINKDADLLPDTLRIADLSSVFDYDPYSWFISKIMSLAYSSLIDYNSNTQEIIPGLAKQWYVTNNSLEWTFLLRENVHFHDGTELTSFEVKYSLERFFDPSHPDFIDQPYLGDVRSIPFDSITVKNKYEFTITLSEPYSIFLPKLSYISIITPNCIENSIFTNPIGTGPYRIDTDTSTDGLINFTRFDDYFKGRAPFKFIKYESFNENYGENKSLELNTLIESEKVDLVMDRGAILSNFYDNDVKKNSTIWEVNYVPGTATHHFGAFNFSNEILSLPDVRKALNYAIDRQQYIDQINDGLGTPKNSILPNGLTYYDKSLQGYPYNPDLARGLLDQSGFPIENDTFRFEINVTSPYLDRAEFVCSSFEQIEIKCNYEYRSFFDFVEGNFSDLFVVGLFHFPDVGLVWDFAHSSGLVNVGGFSDPSVDIILDKAIQTPVIQEQQFYYLLLQSIFQESAPYLLLQDLPWYYAVKKEINNTIRLSSIPLIQFTQFYSKDAIQEITVSNVDVFLTPIYIEKTDLMIFNSKENELKFNISSSNNLDSLVQSTAVSGNIYNIEVDDKISHYRLRFYQEISQNLTFQKPFIYKFDPDSNSWSNVEIVNENSHFRFVESELKGNSFLLLTSTRINFDQLSFSLLPFSLSITLIMTFITLVTVVKNQKFANNARKNDYE